MDEYHAKTADFLSLFILSFLVFCYSSCFCSSSFLIFIYFAAVMSSFFFILFICIDLSSQPLALTLLLPLSLFFTFNPTICLLLILYVGLSCLFFYIEKFVLMYCIKYLHDYFFVVFHMMSV
jgi:hypothetical protein